MGHSFVRARDGASERRVLQRQQFYPILTQAAICLNVIGALAGCIPSDDLAETRLPTLDEIAAQAVATGMPGVSIAVVEPDGSISTGAAGLSDRRTGEALTPAGQFHSGSTTKPITAAAILLLVDRRELSLEARLRDLLPAGVISGVPHTGQITVLQLLEHRSGLYSPNSDRKYAARYIGPDRNRLPFWTASEIVGFAADPSNEPAFAPGEGQEYSDINYVLLSLIVQQTADVSFKAFVQRELFDRVGMPATFYLSDRPDAPRIRGYTIDSDIVRDFGLDPALEADDEGYIDTTALQQYSDGAAGLITTVADLGRFAHAATQTGLLSPASREIFLAAADRIGDTEAGESLGVLRGHAFDYGRVVTSEGNGPGTNVVWALDVETNRIVAAAVNLFGRWDENDYLLTELIPATLAVGN